jgi:hypothetical protein
MGYEVIQVFRNVHMSLTYYVVLTADLLYGIYFRNCAYVIDQSQGHAGTSIYLNKTLCRLD